MRRTIDNESKERKKEITVKILVFDLRFDRCNFCYRNWDFDWIRTTAQIAADMTGQGVMAREGLNCEVN